LIKIFSIYKKIILLLTDLIIISFSILFSFSIRLDELYSFQKIDIRIYLIYFFVIGLVFLYFRIYNIIIRFFDFHSIVKIAKAVFFSQLILIFINFYTYDKFFFPRSVSFIAPLVVGLLVVLSRIAFSFIVSNKNINYIKRNTLLYGIDNETVLFSKSLRNTNSLYNIIGFIDHSGEFKEREVNGIRIYKKQNFINVLKEKKISDIFVGKNILNNKEIKKVYNSLKDFYIRINIIDSSKINFTNKKRQITKNNSIDYYSVLNRSKIKINYELLKKKIKNKIILVTGAGGSIGSELCIQILKFNPKKLVMLDNSELNLFNIYNKILKKNFLFKKKIELKLADCSDLKLLKQTLSQYKFNEIYHAAAYKHLDFLEKNILAAVKNNIFGTINVVNFAVINKVSNFTFVSTDKAVNPKSILGITKKFGEIIVGFYYRLIKVKSKFTIVRFGNVFGSSGSAIPLFMKQVKDGGPVTVRNKNTKRYFMSIEESVELILYSSAINKSFNIFALDMGEQIKIYDVAKKIIQLNGYSIKNKENPLGDIVIKTTPLLKGEKISEELSLGKNLQKTSHPKILICGEKDIYLDINAKIGFLNNLIKKNKLSKNKLMKILN
jgi:FlaA1/EpsC-like NDP-sugar epimerase